MLVQVSHRHFVVHVALWGTDRIRQRIGTATYSSSVGAGLALVVAVGWHARTFGLKLASRVYIFARDLTAALVLIFRLLLLLKLARLFLEELHDSGGLVLREGARSLFSSRLLLGLGVRGLIGFLVFAKLGGLAQFRQSSSLLLRLWLGC